MTVLVAVLGVMPSVTVSVTVYGPGLANVVCAVGPLAGVPARSQVWPVMVPVELEVNVTASPVFGPAGA